MHKLHDDEWPRSAPTIAARRRPTRIRLWLAATLISALAAALWPQGLWPASDRYGVSWFHGLLACAWFALAIGWRVSPRRVARKLLTPLFVLAVGGALMLLVNGWEAGLPMATGALVRGGLSVAIISLAACAFSPEEIVHGLAGLGAPRALMGGVAGMLRYAALFRGEMERMRRARAARSVRSTTLLSRDGYRVEASLVGGAVLRALVRSERIQAAMLARGYDGRIDPWLPQREGPSDVA